MTPTTPDPETTPRPRSRWVFPTAVAVAVTVAVTALAVTAGTGTSDAALATAPGNTPAAVSTATPEAPAAKGVPATGNPAADAAPGTPAKNAATPGKPGVPLDNTHAKASLHTFLGAVADIGSAPDVADQLSDVASGAILAELGNDQLELDTNGWTQHGQPVVDAVKVLTSNTATHAATVQACIDSTAVEILDSDGAPVGHPDPATRRALNIYTLHQQADGTWQVTDRTFPDNPTC